MKKFILIIIILFLTKLITSQIVFNRVINDTVAHITNTVIATDSNYIILTGTNNEHLVRCFSLISIDSLGNKQYKKVHGDILNEYWEGHNNCLKEDNSFYYLSGTFKNNSQNTCGTHINKIGYNLNLIEQSVISDDTISKSSYNSIFHTYGDIFLTGWLDDDLMDDVYLLLIKTDSNGIFKWQKTYGQRYEYGEQIIETSDRNILIGGGTFSFPTTTTDEDWYLIKLDTAGNVIWKKGFGRGGFLNYDGPVRGLIESSDSNYIACGGYPALRSDTDTYWDGCIRKVSKDGELMWEKFYRFYTYYPPVGPTTFKCSLSAILQQDNDDLLILGNSYSHYPKQRGFLMQTNTLGQIKWCRHYYAIDSTSRDQYLVSVKETQDKGFILAGYGNDYNTFGYDPPQQAWLVKTDSLGLDGLCYTELPELNFDIEIPEIICANDTIQVYVNIAGKSAPYTIEFSTGQIIDSIYYPPTFVPVEIGLSLAEIDYAGEIIYSEQIIEATLSNHEWGQCIAKPVEFCTPQFYGTHNIDITVIDAYGESKTITKTFYAISCDDNIETENECPVKLYPNPVRDKVYLDIPQMIASTTLSHHLKAELYNTAGQIIKTTTIHKGLNIVDVSEFVSGSYIIRVTTEDKTFSLGFEKE